MPKTYDLEAVEYIAKIADGHMRDALTMLDKCLAYSTELKVDNVVKVLGVADYSIMQAITDGVIQKDVGYVVDKIESLHRGGVDLKQFVRQYLNFIVDVNKYILTRDVSLTQLPCTIEVTSWLNELTDVEVETCLRLMDTLVKLNADVKWDSNPKYIIEAVLIKECA